ncbi:MAG: inorganic diphosphatase [Candidatus Promineifilaceae bacterium]
MTSQAITQAKACLYKIVSVTIDRPLGSIHPEWGFVYPVNYGYIKNTLSGDGEPLDAYVLGVTTPCETFQGQCVAVIHRQNDDDDKLIVVPGGVRLTDADIRKYTHFQEQFFQIDIIREAD